MKALLLSQSNLALTECALPVVELGEILIKVQFVGLCRTDLYIIDKQIKANLPIIPGHEFSGIVVSGDDYFKPGDRVTANPYLACGHCQSCEQNGKHTCLNMSMLGLHRDGVLAEYVKVPRKFVYKIPANVTTQAAAFSEPVAACSGVLNSGIKPEQKGVIIGNNRIANLTLRICQMRGFSDIEVKEVDELADNHYDFVIETQASDVIIEKAIKALKPQGVLVIKSRSFTGVTIPFNALIVKELQLKAVHYGPFDESLLMLEGGLEVDNLMGPTFPLTDVLNALALARAGETKKVFIQVDNG